VNWQHFRAFLWLRWRLRINQLKRGGIANIVVLVVLLVGAVVLAAGMLVGSFLLGWLALPLAPTVVVLLAWDGVVFLFLLFWLIGLITELQRSDALSLDKFLHLPVSLTGVFLINYLSSLFSMNLVIFGPAILGLSLGLVLGLGPAMLVQLPLAAAFVLMVTAVTYQFQGWLASLMVNKRRRRTIIVLLTAFVILVGQLPTLINLARPWDIELEDPHDPKLVEQRKKLSHMLAQKQITDGEYIRRNAELERQHQKKTEEAEEQFLQQLDQTAWIINLVLPVGWLPLGARAAADGNLWPALLGTLGLALLGVASLWRSYRTTVRMYTGHFTAGTRPAAGTPPTAVKATNASAGLLTWRIPWMSEQAAAIALASFRSLFRAPEAKMMLLTPVITLVLFGYLSVANAAHLPELVRPVVAFGGLSMTMLSMVSIVGNQFGFDRSGFRVFVLCAAPRREILLGKNLAIAPFALGLGLVMVVVVQVLLPMRWDHVLAVLVRLTSMFLVFCMVCNCLSIASPMAVASGSFKPVNPKPMQVLLQLVIISLLPLALGPLLLPLGIEALLQVLGWRAGVPVDLLLSVVVCAVVVSVYRLVVKWQGTWLHWREQRILESVTTKAE
jgi:hypothetical protein